MMEEKDNVCGMVSTAVQEKENETRLGKFKDVSALLQAYNALQAEFTRRSQKLKQLERRDNSDEGQDLSCVGGKEKNLESETQKREGQGLNEALEPVGQEQEQGNPADDGKKEDVYDMVGGEAATEQAGRQATDGDAKTGPHGDELYLLASKDEKVRLRIVGDYLRSLQKAGAPLSRGGVGALTTPPKKAKTIDDAGNMAFALFTGAKQQTF